MMYCQNCGNRLADGDRFCRKCGWSLNNGEPRAAFSEPVIRYDMPPENKPVSPWNYALMYILFLIPVIGLIASIVLSFNSNVNIKNFARALWCVVVLAIVLFIAVVVIGGITGTTDQLFELLEDLGFIEYG